MDPSTEKEKQRKTLRERGICVIIPTYNNGQTIGRVAQETLAECDDVIVVDDGCTDNTEEELSKVSGITVVRHDKNRGKGQALKSGFAKAKELGFCYAITLDGDGQHYPRDIARLLKANQQHPGAIIIGKRNLTNAERSGGSKFANAFSNFWFNVQTGRMLSDTQSGYRLYPLKKLHLLPLVSARYEAELSLLVFASWHGVEIHETLIDVYYPPREERVSHFRPAADFTRISILNTLLCVMAVVYGLPLAVIRITAKSLRTAYTLAVFSVSLLLVFTPAVWLIERISIIREKRDEKESESLHKSRLRRRRQRVQWLIHHVARFVMVVHGIPGVKYKASIDSQTDLRRPSVIVSNHISALDMLCKLCVAPNIIFLTKDWVRNNLFFGFIVRCAGYPSSSEGIEAIIPELKEQMEQGNNIVIYPEGTRSKDGNIGRYHQGAFVIAEKLGASITPAVVYGTNRVLRKRSLWINKGTVELKIGKPISQRELQAIGGPLQQASELRRRSQAAYESLANKIEQDA